MNNKLNLHRYVEGEGITKKPSMGGIRVFFLKQYNVKYVNGDSPRKVIASTKCKTITTVLNNLQLHMCVSHLKEQLKSWSLVL